MTFKNVRFPTGIRYGAMATPGYKTHVAQVTSGRTQRNKMRTYPLRKFNIERALTTAALLEEALSFFHVMNGSADTFRVKDPTDYQVAITQGVFVALSITRYQMYKRYTVGAYTKDVLVVLPVSGSIVIPGLTENTHFAIDYTTASGIVTLISSPTPAPPTTWSGQYDVHCRFESDEFPLQVAEKNDVELQQIIITEESNLG